MKAAQYVREYLGKHASIRDCLQKGLINYSQLSRDIIANASVNLPFDAVLVACRRVAKQLEKVSQEKEILQVLAESKIEVRNKVGVFVVSRDIDEDKREAIRKIIPKKERYQTVVGEDTFSFFFPMDYYDEIGKTLKGKILSKHKNMLEIRLKSPKQIETTPGVLAFVLSLFGQYGINIFETISCYRDTVIIIHEKDMEKMVQTMKFAGG